VRRGGRLSAARRARSARGITAVSFTRAFASPALAALHRAALHLGEPTAAGWRLAAA
jgi:hypothetical protein